MTDNLLPCTFCGERAHMHAVNGPYCGNFECALHLVSGFNLDTWNKRAWQAAQSEPVERPDCGTCANRGRVDGLSQETFCEHCSWSEKWRKNHYKPIAMQERQS